MGKIPFAKPARSLDEQLALLKSRGLIVANDDLAKSYLENISYYRLSGYTRYFSDPGDDKRQLFREGTTLEHVIKLYVFDRLLRSLLSEAFERIEIAFKGTLAHHGAMLAGPQWMTDPSNFNHNKHETVIKLMTEACIPKDGKHKQVFLEAFYTKYSDEFPPAWMVTEALSLGGISTIYKLTKGFIRIPAAAKFDVQQDVLESWMHALTFARNVCAHHARFWNRRFTIEPQIPKMYVGIWPAPARDRLYLRCCIAHHLLQRSGGETTWNARLRALINKRPGVPLSHMGFPDDWEGQAFWGFAK